MSSGLVSVGEDEFAAGFVDGEWVGWAGGLDGSGDVGPVAAIDRILTVEHHGKGGVEGSGVGVAVGVFVVFIYVAEGFGQFWIVRSSWVGGGDGFPVAEVPAIFHRNEFESHVRHCDIGRFFVGFYFAPVDVREVR